MQELATVKKVYGDKAIVSIDKKTECSKCGMCLFPQGANSVEFEVNNNKVFAQEGDMVIVDNKHDGKLLGSTLAFFVPLVLILVAGLITHFLIGKEIWMLILSVIFIVLWYTILALIDKKLKKKHLVREIVCIVQKGEKDDSNTNNGEN